MIQLFGGESSVRRAIREIAATLEIEVSADGAENAAAADVRSGDGAPVRDAWIDLGLPP
ncbi:MAG: hypothetical protein HKN12_03765, partial [Gemmatimonadetes bacterium]|nr:hypothetical protein [Gemmatimonadota bacterium]